MTTLREALLKAYNARPEPDVGAVADTWFPLGVLSHGLLQLLVSHALNKAGIHVRLPWDVQRECDYFYNASPPVRDSAGVPLAPYPLASIVENRIDHLAVRVITESDSNTFGNAALDVADKYAIKEAKIVAAKHGFCYLVTNDTEVIREARREARREGLDIRLLMPSVIEQELSPLLPELGLQLLVPDTVVDALYRRGSGGREQEGTLYIHVERRKQYTLGQTAITVDLATGLESVLRGKKVPARTNDYGIPVVFTQAAGEEHLARALLSVFPKPPKRAVLAVVPASEKHFPRILKIEANKTDVTYQTLTWARRSAYHRK